MPKYGYQSSPETVSYTHLHALELAGVEAKMGMLARRLYSEFVAAGGGTTDFSGIINSIREASAR